MSVDNLSEKAWEPSLFLTNANNLAGRFNKKGLFLLEGPHLSCWQLEHGADETQDPDETCVFFAHRRSGCWASLAGYVQRPAEEQAAERIVRAHSVAGRQQLTMTVGGSLRSLPMVPFGDLQAPSDGLFLRTNHSDGDSQGLWMHQNASEKGTEGPTQDAIAKERRTASSSRVIGLTTDDAFTDTAAQGQQSNSRVRCTR
ncbi:hypothetical protein PMIN03_009386 [Paraphaeosphaeria minitans]